MIQVFVVTGNMSLELGLCCFVLRNIVIGVLAHPVSIRKVELEA